MTSTGPRHNDAPSLDDLVDAPELKAEIRKMLPPIFEVFSGAKSGVSYLVETSGVDEQSVIEVLVSLKDMPLLNAIADWLIQAWALIKGFRPKDGSSKLPGSGKNSERDFKSETRSNDIHGSITDDNARPYRKAKRRSAIDGRITRHPGYGVSQRKRKRIEEICGWLKTVPVYANRSFVGLSESEQVLPSC